MSLLAAALTSRLPIFAVGADKIPLEKGGYKNATTDPDALRRMFSDARAAGIALPTGTLTEIVAIDVDNRSYGSGMPWLDAHADMLPPTRRHRTRSGGVHLLYRQPPGPVIRNSAGRIAVGVDVRGEGGAIVIPPTPGYTLAQDAPLAVLPEWLAALCRPPPKRAAPPPSYVPQDTDAWRKLMRAVVKIGQAGEGQRNSTLNAQAYYVAGLIGHGLGENEAAAALFQAARQCGLPEPEIKATLLSAFRAGIK